MSDKITKTVTFEIEQSGCCGKCDGLIKAVRYCMPFGIQLKSEVDWQYNSTYEQCQPCKDYLSEQKSKVYCNGCKHVAYIKSGFCAGTRNGMSCHVCTIKNNQIITQPTNCQDRSE